MTWLRTTRKVRMIFEIVNKVELGEKGLEGEMEEQDEKAEK